MVQLTSARPSDVAAVVADTPPDTAVVVMSGQGVTVMVVVIAGGRRMRGRVVAMPMATQVVAVWRINTVRAVARNRVMRGRAAMATAKAGRLNTRILPASAVRVATAGNRTSHVTITVAVVKVGPGSLRADSLPAAGSDIARAVDARADDGNRSGCHTCRVRGADRAVSPFGIFGVSCSA